MVAAHPLSDPTRCLHCGGELPSPGLKYCCGGCETVHGLLSSRGLEDYYRLRGDTTARPAKTTSRTYSDFDDEALLAKASVPTGDACRRVDLYLEGTHCGACVWLVERLMKDAPGVADARLDLGRSTLSLRWDPAKTELSSLARSLDRAGYPPHLAHDVDRQAARRRADRRLLVQIAVAGACFGNAMLMAFALYGGMFAGMEAEWSELFRWASLLVAIPSVSYSARPFFRGAIESLRARVPHMDLPIAVGLSLGFAAGVVNTLRGAGEIYFDSLTALVFLLLIGRWLQAREQRKASDAAELLYALAPATARLIEGDATREVPAENVPAGSLVEVRPHELVPADGVVEDGASSLDVSLLTGESRPIEIGPGARVAAGTLNLTARVTVRVEESGARSRLGRLLSLVAEASSARAPIVLEADKLAARFVARVLTLAALTLLGWLFVSPGEAVDHAIALLVVSCPCALALATPLAVTAAIGRAARAGIFVKGGDTLERLARPATVWFDKTGTLTEGKLAVVESDGEERALAGALAQATAHPVSRAIALAFPAPGALAVDLEHTPGGGVAGTVSGRRVALGSPRHLESLGVPTDGAWTAWAERGLTPVLLADLDRRRLIGAFGVADRVREGAKAALERVRAFGYRPGILSGDDPRVVRELARELGVPEDMAKGGMSPEAKLGVVEATVGPVIMVGDGANDAAALARAEVGIAVHGGSEASLSAAHVFTGRPGLEPVLEALEGSRATLGIIRRNMRISLAYNVVGVSLAAFGLIGPLGAAILMPVSSLTVVISSIRSRSFGRKV